MSGKLGLVMAGILTVVTGGVFLAGQFFFQQESTALPEQDEPAAPVVVNQKKPPAVTIEKSEPVNEQKITLVSDPNEPPPTPADSEESREPMSKVDPKPAPDDLFKQNLVRQMDLAKGPPALVPPPVAPTVPGLPTQAPEPPLSPPPLNLNVSPPAAVAATAPMAINCPWNIQVEVVKGRTIVTAKAGKDASFRIECDQLDLQSPRGCLKATGKVKISSNGLDGTSNALTLNLQEDRLVLEGDVKVRSRRDKQDLELTGDRVSLRLINNVIETKFGGFPNIYEF